MGRIKSKIRQFEVISKYHGIAYSNFDKLTYITYLWPLNHVVRLVRFLWLKTRNAKCIHLLSRDEYKDAFNAGVRLGNTQGYDRCIKEDEELYSRIMKKVKYKEEQTQLEREQASALTKEPLDPCSSRLQKERIKNDIDQNNC